MATVTSGLFGPVASGANSSAAISGGSSAAAIAMLNQMQSSGQYSSPERAWEAWQAMQNQTNVAKPWTNPYGNIPDETGMDHPMTVVGGHYGTFHGEAPGGFDMPSLVGQGGTSGGGGGGGGSSGGGAGSGTNKPLDPTKPGGTNTNPGGGMPLGGGPLPSGGSTYFPTNPVPGGGIQQPGGPIGGQQPGGPGPSPGSQPQGPNSGAVDNYLNSPMNQLLGDPSYQRFEHSPGYQYAVDEALRQVQRGGASRGLLESGAVMRDMTDRAQGMAQQDYGNWWNRQSQLFGNYQDRLSGLAAGPTGADQAFQLGQNQAAGSMQTGGNLGSLFGNQGMGGFGGMVNVGGLQAGNNMQAGNQQAQVLSANQATLLANQQLQQQPQQTTRRF